MPHKLTITTHDLDPRLSQRLLKFKQEAVGAYAPNTLKAWQQDSAVFAEFCLLRNVRSLPATPEVVAAFIKHLANTKKSATIRRVVASITKLHEAAGVDNPCSTSTVKHTLREVHRKKGRAQDQVDPLNWAHIDHALQVIPNDSLRQVLDKAMVLVAYDGLLRPEEITRIERSDFTFNRDDSGTLFIAKSKGDQEGRGAEVYLSKSTVRHVDAWLSMAGIESGPVFRPVMKSGEMGEKVISTKGVSRAFKRIALAAGMDDTKVSGHSCRIGAAQDLHEQGMSLLEVQTGGRWKSSEMPALYTRRLAAAKGGMAKLAEIQGR